MWSQSFWYVAIYLHKVMKAASTLYLFCPLNWCYHIHTQFLIAYMYNQNFSTYAVLVDILGFEQKVGWHCTSCLAVPGYYFRLTWYRSNTASWRNTSRHCGTSSKMTPVATTDVCCSALWGGTRIKFSIFKFCQKLHSWM